MGFTCNFGKALLRFPLLGTYNNVAGGTCVRHTGEEDPGKKTLRARFFVRRQLSKLLAARPPPVPLVVTVVTHLRFHRLHPLAAFSHSPPSLPRARLSPLNVRGDLHARIYCSQDFTKGCDPRPKRDAASSLFFSFRERKIIFLRGNVRGADIFLLGNHSNSSRIEVYAFGEEGICKNCQALTVAWSMLERLYYSVLENNLATCCYVIDANAISRVNRSSL